MLHVARCTRACVCTFLRSCTGGAVKSTKLHSLFFFFSIYLFNIVRTCSCVCVCTCVRPVRAHTFTNLLATHKISLPRAKQVGAPTASRARLMGQSLAVQSDSIGAQFIATTATLTCFATKQIIISLQQLVMVRYAG